MFLGFLCNAYFTLFIALFKRKEIYRDVPFYNTEFLIFTTAFANHWASLSNKFFILERRVFHCLKIRLGLSVVKVFICLLNRRCLLSNLFKDNIQI